MLATPSILFKELWGTAGGICIRRLRGRFIVQRPPQNLPPSEPPPAGVIVDNADPGWAIQNGTWALLPDPGDAHGPDYRRGIAAFPPNIPWSRFTPQLPSPATYQISVWWPTDPLASVQATFGIKHDAGTSWYYPDQTVNQGQWNLIDTLPLTPGNTHVEAQAPYFWNTLADAVKWELVT